MADPAKPSARKAKPKPSPKPAASPATDNGSPSGHTFTRSAVIDSDWDTKEAKSPEPAPPIHVAIPNTTAEKMQAITMLCSAVQRLAATLESVNCPVLVSNCSVFGSQGPGMNFSVSQETPETKFARQVAEYIASGGKRS